MQPPHRLALCEERLVLVWERLVATLGMHTACILLERAMWQTAQRHPALNLIHHDDCGLSFEALEKSYATWPQEEIEAAFNGLFTAMLLILARLLGPEMAERICTDHPGGCFIGVVWPAELRP
jgi:hypothetical protein